MLVPINKKQLKVLLKKEGNKAYFVNDELEAGTLVVEGSGATEDDYVIFVLDPSTITDMMSVRYEHIRDIFIDTKTNKIHFTHEHSEIFLEKITIDVMIIESLDIVSTLGISLDEDKGVSISNLSSGVYLVGEEGIYSDHMTHLGIGVKEVTINLEHEDLPDALEVSDLTMNINSEDGVTITDENDITYKGEDALVKIALATFNIEIEDYFIETERIDKDKVEKYKAIVDKLEPLIGVSDVVDQDNTAIMQNVTEKDIEEGIPLRFYNLETWELVREKLVMEEIEIAEYIGAGTRLSGSGKDMTRGDSISYGAKSQYDVSSEFIKKALDAGEYANILVMQKVAAVGAPPRYTIEEAKVVWTQNISKGLPMFLCKGGALLWPREVSILTKDTFDGLVSSDDYDEVDAGVYTPNFFTFITMLRSFERTNPWEEVDELKALFEYSNNKPDEKYFISGLAVLANEVLSEDAESFDINTDASVHFLSLYESYKPLFSGI